MENTGISFNKLKAKKGDTTLFIIYLSIHIKMDICMFLYIYLCVLTINSGMPRAISTKLDTHITYNPKNNLELRYP